MRMRNRYTIDYQGLTLGEHRMSLSFGDDLFALFDGSPIKHGAGTIVIDLIRQKTLMELSVRIEGEVEIECDRCADEYMQMVDYSGSVVVKLSEQADELREQQDGDIIWLSPRESKLDLSDWIYESIILSLPLQRVHADINDCNQEVLKYISRGDM